MNASTAPSRWSRRAVLALPAAAPALVLPVPARAQALHIRIGTGNDDAFMAPRYAAELGYFRRANLDVEVITLPSPGLIAEAAAAGAIDVGLSEPVALANANARGLPFGYFAGGPVSSRDEPTLVMCVAKDSPYRTAKDLEGKTIAVTVLRSTLGSATQEWMRQNGADYTSAKFFEMHFPEMPAALTRGTIDAALLGEPFLTESKATVRGIGVPFDTVAKLFYIFCWFARRDWIAKNLDATKRLAGALYAAGRWANEHREESAVMQTKSSKVDPAVLKTMARNPLSTSLNPAYIQPVLDLATRYKLLDRTVNASDLIVPGFT